MQKIQNGKNQGGDPYNELKRDVLNEVYIREIRNLINNLSQRKLFLKGKVESKGESGERA